MVTVDGERAHHRLTINKNRVTYKPYAGSTEEERQRCIKFSEHVARLIQSKVRFTVRGKIHCDRDGKLLVSLRSGEETFVMKEGEDNYKYVDNFKQEGVV